MAAIEEVRDLLVADAGVLALVAQRISPLLRAQNETLPCVTLSLVSVVPANHLNGAPTLDQNRVQVDSWAATYTAARSVADACRAALEAAGLTMEGEFDTFEPDVSEYRVTQDFYFWN
jgi:hypothetical protein